MRRFSPRVANTLACGIFLSLAALFFALIWIVGVKGLPLVILFFAGIGCFILALQLLLNATFRGKRTVGQNIENSIFDAIIAVFR